VSARDRTPPAEQDVNAGGRDDKAHDEHTGTGALVAAATPSSSRSATWAVAAAGEVIDSSLAQGFRDPADSYRPKTRWWWTCGDISRAEVEQEISQIAAAGFGGVEILCFSSVNPAANGWGSPGMQDRMEAALELGQELGLDVDFTVGPAWPLVRP